MKEFIFCLICLVSLISFISAEESCGPLPEYPNSEPEENEDTYEVGTIIRYRCKHGYYGSTGSRIITCTAKGKNKPVWTSLELECYPVKCPEPPAPDRGVVRFHSLEFGATAVFKCPNGFYLNGAKTTTCTAEGKWDTLAPPCLEIICPDLPFIENGIFTLTNGDKRIGSIVKYNCNRGFTLNGADTLKCLNSGKWDFQPPVCSSPCVVPKLGRGRMGKNIDGAFIHEKSGNEFQHGDSVLLRCFNGYELPLLRHHEGDVNVTCFLGNWNPLPSCHPAQCRELPPEDGRGTPKQPYNNTHESIVIYYNSCSPFEKPLREKSAICKYGKWNIKEAKCRNSSCEVPFLGKGTIGRIVGGTQKARAYIQEQPGTRISDNEMLLLRCNEGYELPTQEWHEGDIQIFCRVGEWNPKPLCFPARCREPLPSNGLGNPILPYGNSDGSIVVYENACHPSETVLKKKTVTCSKGKWIVSEAMCNEVVCYAKDLLKYNLNTTFISDIKSGSNFPFHCNPGYETVAGSQIRCSNDGWVVTGTPCKAVSCRNPPPAIEKGGTRISSGIHGMKATYYCFRPYELTDTGNLTCQFGQWIGAPATCKDTRCRTKDLEHYVGVRQENTIIPDGSLYQIHCTEGYDRHINDIICRNGEWIGISNLICQPGACAVPFITNGKIINWEWSDNKRTQKEVEGGSFASHGAETFLLCDQSYKLQGLFETGEDGIRIKCDKKKWYPQPGCFLFNSSVTNPIPTDEPVTKSTDIVNTPGKDKNITEPAQTDNPIDVQTDNPIDIQTDNPINPIDVQTDNPIDIQTDNPIDVQTDNPIDVQTDNPIDVSPTVPNVPRNCTYIPEGQLIRAFIKTSPIKKEVLRHGTVLRFGCDRIGQYRLVGPSKVTCRDGSWVPKFPKCIYPQGDDDVHFTIHSVETSYILPHDVLLVEEHNKIYIACYTVKRDSWPLLSSNATVQVRSKNVKSQDDTLYTIIVIEDVSEQHEGNYFCNSKSGDQHSIYIMVKAKTKVEVFCQNLESDSEAVPERNVPVGTKVDFSCDSKDSLLIGPKEITCLETGEWSDKPAICEALKEEPSCPEINPTANLKISYVPSEKTISVDTEARFSCIRKNRKLIGPETIKCLETGQWSENPPVCVKVCPDPGNIDHGIREDDSFIIGSEVQYSCEKGYRLVGESVLYCNKFGRWSNELPSCVAHRCDSFDLVDNLDTDVFPGNLTSETVPVGTVALLVCASENLILLGVKNATCLQNGQWEIGKTRCVSGCYHIEVPPDSSLIITGKKESYRIGDILTFSCPKDYELDIDLELIFCLRHGWSDNRLPQCLPSKKRKV